VRGLLFRPGVLYEETLYFLLFLLIFQLWNVLAVLHFSASYAIPFSREKTVAPWEHPRTLQQRGKAHPTSVSARRSASTARRETNRATTGHVLACFWKLERLLAQKKTGTTKNHPPDKVRRKEEQLLMR
jgi:hypothetical protein